jgi:hypothetical protein
VTPPPDQPEPGDAPRPLRTEARPLVVHWAVDTAVLFLATIIVGLFLGASWWAVLLVAAGLGSLAAPLTRRADERAMATRRAC